MRLHRPIVRSFVVVAAGWAAGPASGGDESAVDRALARLDALDRAVISIDVDDEPLGELLAQLASASPVPLAADWTALDRIGVSDHDEVTLHFRSAPMSTVLAGLVLQLGDDLERARFEAHAGRVVLTTLDGTAGMTLTDVYDVRDLLGRQGLLDELRETAPPIPEPETDDRAGDEPRPDTPDPIIEPSTAAETLIHLITDHVEPEAWMQHGGWQASITDREGVLLVTATPTTHRRLRAALRKLRRAWFTAVAIDAAIVDVPASSLARLRRRHELASATLGRALLDHDDARLVWRSAAVVRLGATMRAESEGDATQVTLVLDPRFDRSAGLFLIDVTAKTVADGDRRTLETTVTIPFRQGGAVLELADPAGGGVARLLVLIPKRIQFERSVRPFGPTLASEGRGEFIRRGLAGVDCSRPTPSKPRAAPRRFERRG